MIASLLIAVGAPQDAPPSVPPIEKPTISIAPAPIAVPLVSAMSPDHQRLAVETRIDGVWIFNLTTSAWDLRIKPKDPHTIDIAWSADGTKLALVGSQGPISIVDSANGKIGRVLATPLRSVKLWLTPDLVTFACGSDVLVTALGNDTSELWSTVTGERVAVLAPTANAKPTTFATSRNGELIAIGTGAGSVSVWKARTGEFVASLLDLPSGAQHKARINSLDFDPSGRVLAIGGGDCFVRLWTVAKDGGVRRLSHCDADIFECLAIGSVRFNRDGSRLLSTSFDYWDARVWDVESERVVDHFDFNGGNPATLPAWFSTDESVVILSLGCRTGRIDGSVPRSSEELAGDLKLVPGGFPDHEQYIWWTSDGEHAWAVVDNQLVLRAPSDPTPVVRIPITPPASLATDAEGK